MKHNFSVSFANSLKKDGLPIFKINLLRTLSFNVLIDTGIKHNLIDPSFIYFQVYEDYDTYIEDENYIGNTTPNHNYVYLFKDFFEKLGTHEVIGKNGIKQYVDKINFKFEFKGETFTDLFSVVEINSTHYFSKGRNIDVVLGTDFLIKHNWIIDYNKKVIYSPENS
jgi:hypothetical protein